MDTLLKKIKSCQICKDHLPCEPNPVLQFSKSSKILIVGQAPGILAHRSCKPWNDKSGQRLRSWLGLSEDKFYDPYLIALVPMGFCYPGKGKTGDLPPRKECSFEWTDTIRSYLTNIKLEIYIGKYACDSKFKKYKNLTTLIKDSYKSLDNKIILPHPSPRNNIWFAKNLWFEKHAIPHIKKKCHSFL